MSLYQSKFKTEDIIGFSTTGKSIKSSHNHSASMVDVSSASSSASMVDLIKMVWLHDDLHDTAHPPIVKT
jgi:hypothetical protein